MKTQNLRKPVFFLILIVFFTVNTYAQEIPSLVNGQPSKDKKQEVEIYKGGKRYTPGQKEEPISAPEGKQPPAEETKTITPPVKTPVDFKKILENLSKVLTKDQMDQIMKNMQTIPQFGNTEDFEQGNFENLIGNSAN